MNLLFQLNDDNCFFPPAEYANQDGLLAFGGDLSPERLINAYANGIFPWYNEDEPLLWWSLDPRLIIRQVDDSVESAFRHRAIAARDLVDAFDDDVAAGDIFGLHLVEILLRGVDSGLGKDLTEARRAVLAILAYMSVHSKFSPAAASFRLVLVSGTSPS